MIRVVFVCLGNICRSPMAEAVFQQLVREAGLDDKIEADSAGTGHWHIGEPPHRGTRAILEKHHIPYTSCARLLSRRDLDEAAYLIAMDNENLADIRALGSGRARIARLMDYAPERGVEEVPDPYYNGRFEEVYDLVKDGAAGLLAAIRREHGL